MAKQEISNDAVYLLFEEIRDELDKLGKNSHTQQPASTVDLTPIADRLEYLQKQLTRLAEKTDNISLLAEIQDIKRKINNLPEPRSGATTRELEQGLSILQKNLTQTIQSTAKKSTVVKNKLSPWKFYTIVTIIAMLACIGGYYAERYYGMKKKNELLERYYVRYKYIQIKEKTTKAELQWINKAPTDSIASLIIELDEKKNLKSKKEQK